MQAKYQVWVDDSILIGHVYPDTTATEDDVKYMAIDFTAETWGDVEDSQINTCGFQRVQFLAATLQKRARKTR